MFPALHSVIGAMGIEATARTLGDVRIASTLSVSQQGPWPRRDGKAWGLNWIQYDGMMACVLTLNHAAFPEV
jgi:hypothetical protein